MIEDTAFYRYARDVADGAITACLPVIQACRRFLCDLERDDLFFDMKKASKGLKFISSLRHFEGKSSGEPFILEPFQEFIVANLLGWHWKETGDRRFTSAYIEMARKGGKTALIAAIAMYYFLADGEDAAEIDMAANNYEQAKICFKFIQQYSRQLDPKGKQLKVYRNSVTLDANASRVNVFSSDDKGKDGFNASVGIIDEYHSAPNTKMRDVIKSSMGMRRNPMLLTITSAGFDKTLPCYKLRTTCIEILQGLKTDDSMFAMVFTLDEDDDWQDPSVWIKSNPNLGKTVTEKFLREQVLSAVNNPEEELSVRTKNLGQWLSSVDIWIPERYILDCSQKMELEDFAGCNCWVGADLGAVSDMTALTFLIQPESGDGDDDEDEDTEADTRLRLKTFYYLPETALDESPNRDLYRLWKRMGLLKITPGNVTDYQWITNDLMAQNESLTIRAVFYDKWNSTSWATECTSLGLNMEEYSQSIGNFNRPTREFERLCRSQRIVIDDNEITRWMFANVALKTDHNGNAKPNKGAGKDKKIDGVISMLTALGGWMEDAGGYAKLTVI